MKKKTAQFKECAFKVIVNICQKSTSRYKKIIIIVIIMTNRKNKR